MEKEFKCEACGYESDEPADFIKNADKLGTFCNDCPSEKEFKSLSGKIDGKGNISGFYVKEFIKRCVRRFQSINDDMAEMIIKEEVGPKLICNT